MKKGGMKMEKILDIIKGVILSYTIALIILFIYAFILAKTQITERYINLVVILTMCISSLLR